jgi:hypothetical protein
MGRRRQRKVLETAQRTAAIVTPISKDVGKRMLKEASIRSSRAKKVLRRISQELSNSEGRRWEVTTSSPPIAELFSRSLLCLQIS